MGKPKFEQIQEGAYFVVDLSGFQSTITSYDPLLANQTLVSLWNKEELDNNQKAKEDDTHDETKEIVV